jgi:hypothetical protein
MKNIKFIMSKGENLLLPYEQAKKVLESPNQINRVLDENGEWTGMIINKAHIIYTQEENTSRKDLKIKKLPEPEGNNNDLREIMSNWFNRMKENGCFLKYNSYKEWEKK